LMQKVIVGKRGGDVAEKKIKHLGQKISNWG